MTRKKSRKGKQNKTGNPISSTSGSATGVNNLAFTVCRSTWRLIGRIILALRLVLDRRLDDVINKYKLPCVCSVTDYRWCQNVVGTSVTLGYRLVCNFFCSDHIFDVISDQLLNKRTVTCNLQSVGAWVQQWSCKTSPFTPIRLDQLKAEAYHL